MIGTLPLPALEAVECPDCQGYGHVGGEYGHRCETCGCTTSTVEMASTQRYVGASTAFGVITRISGGVYNPSAAVQAKDGDIRMYQLPFLLAFGVKLAEKRAA
jgi:DnaJ-class molecular chaperone